MSWILLVSILLFFTSCQSKPVEVAAPARPGKPTVALNSSSSTLELFSEVAYGPRRASEIDTSLSLNPKVQGCFRGQIGAGQMLVTVTVDGKITFGGEVDDIQVRGGDPGLEKCLLEALKTVHMGRGRIGPFKMRLSTERGRLKGGKGLIIETPPAVKFE